MLRPGRSSSTGLPNVVLPALAHVVPNDALRAATVGRGVLAIAVAPPAGPPDREGDRAAGFGDLLAEPGGLGACEGSSVRRRATGRHASRRLASVNRHATTGRPSRHPAMLGAMLAAAVALAAFAAPRGAHSDAEVQAHAPVAADPDGWIPLFNGRDLDDWVIKVKGQPLGVDPLRTARVEDGVLRMVYDEYDRFDGRFAHLFHRLPWSHYRIRIEYRFVGEQSPGGPGWAWRNSGVMLHCQAPETMRVDQDFPVSIEVQFLGGDGEHPRSTANLCTPGTHVEMGGELVTRHCTDADAPTFHGDRWVVVEAEVRGDEIVRHLVDGKVVIEYEHPQLDPNDADAKRLIGTSPDGTPALRLAKGWVALQGESHPVEFRRVEILPLRPE